MTSTVLTAGHVSPGSPVPMAPKRRIASGVSAAVSSSGQSFGGFPPASMLVNTA
jgi:hypothetical protein